MTPHTQRPIVNAWAASHHVDCEPIHMGDPPSFLNPHHPWHPGDPWQGGVCLNFIPLKGHSISVWLNPDGKDGTAGWYCRERHECILRSIPDFTEESEIPGILNLVRNEFLRDWIYMPAVSLWLVRRGATIGRQYARTVSSTLCDCREWPEEYFGHWCHEWHHLEFTAPFLKRKKGIIAISGLGQAAIFRRTAKDQSLIAHASGLTSASAFAAWLDGQYPPTDSG